MLQMKKIMFSMFMILLCLLGSGFYSFPVYADSVIAEGTLMDDFAWSVTEDGTLILSGSGELVYNSEMEYPWISDYQSHICRVIVEEGITTFDFFCLEDLKNLTEIQLPQSLETLNGFLSGCKCVATLNLPENLSQLSVDIFRYDIGDPIYVPWVRSQGDFFSYKDVLLLYQGNDSVVQVPDNIKVIDKSAFEGCKGISEIVLPDGLEEIGERAFKNCDKLEKLNLPASVKHIGTGAFSSNEDKYGIPWLKAQGDFLIHNGTLYWSRAAHDYTTEIVIPNGVKSIAADVFRESSLKKVILPQGLESIGERAFLGTEISEINLPNSIKSVGYYAFNECPLEYVVIPDSLTEVGQKAFGTAQLLTSEDRVHRKITISEDSLYSIILVVLLILIVSYIVGVFKGGYFEGEPLSKEYRRQHKFNQTLYSVFCISFICAILCIELNIDRLPFRNELADTVFDTAYTYLPWIFGLSGLLWFLTELVRDDFPWGMARIGARALKFGILIIATALLAELIQHYPATFAFIGYLALAGLCFFVAVLFGMFLFVIPVLLDYLLSLVFRRDIKFFRVLLSISSALMEAAADFIDSLPKTYEDVRIFKLDDDTRKIDVDGEIRKLRRESPYSDTFVDVKDPTKRYKEK